MIQKISLITLFVALPLAAVVETDLKDISVSEPELTIMLDENVQFLCKQIAELYKKHGYSCSDGDLAMLVNAREELDCESALQALDSLIHDRRSIEIEEAQDLKSLLEEYYNKLLEEYYQLTAQSTRRTKVKFFSRINTRDFFATNASVTSKLITECLQIGQLDGVIKSTPSACLTAGLVESDDIAASAVINSKIADSTISTAKLNFYPVIANSEEGVALSVYRGSVQMDGTINNGAGFTVDHLGTGIYMVTFNATTYSSSYEVFVQFSGNNQFATSIDTSNMGYFTFLVKNLVGTMIDADFTFFTIGN